MRYLVEIYASADRHAETTARARASRGAVQAIYVPEDELCLVVVEAVSEAAVRGALSRTGLRPDRVTVAVAG